ncbi:peptidoglycan-binding domain-containing protein [Nodosilinea sp. PGN35]|uniref:peptidoglycan-binding domain-containing protein n=1 Tax=Nodosilinea sp. PGN35 TaxID=3020489 RepID=UPI0023B33052|nr:peptidoglycan-binding domain-containing protein [Nodosilinea sp. TSF1-S3]MDF0366636.1 peptidoglycan-binding domain-containing protein [Nodosilinea sp. TSF1-S3]
MTIRWTAPACYSLLLLAGLGAGLAPPALAQPAPLVQGESSANTVLDLGDSGPEVQRLQSELSDLGLFAGAIDGQYGPDTAEAVRSLQAQQAIAVDGLAGPQTWRALETARPVATLPPPPLAAGLLTFTPLVVAQPAPPPSALWLALMPLVPIAGGALTYLHRRRQRRQRVLRRRQQRQTLPAKPKP